MPLQRSRNTANRRIEYLARSTEDPLMQDSPNVIFNLCCSPKRISSVYIYDKRGTELFEQQCGTPEYYLRRAESRLLACYSRDILGLCGFLPIVELGAGTAEKTRTFLTEYAKSGVPCDYYPIDVDTETLTEAARRLVSAFPRLFVHCLGTTYQEGLRSLPPCSGPRLFMFLGSSLGNMEWREIEALLLHIFHCSKRGDHFLLGADLDKDPAIINRAYNDASGYGSRSTLNMLHHLNRRYSANFVTSNFRYRSQYDPGLRRNDVRIESLTNQKVTLASLNFSVSFDAAELIDAEIMWKFDPDELTALLNRAGFSMTCRWIEPEYRYGLFLFRHK
jgi:L-histidine Nalpha-methyltransferase